MSDLVIFADDMTGALDTSVQFTKQGIRTVLRLNGAETSYNNCANAQVIVIDTESRHLEPDESYNLLYDLAARYVRRNTSFFYKKTDSVLRGNIGPELKALLDASWIDVAFFVPAYPLTGRTTSNGYQFYNGVRLDQTELAHDMLSSIATSYIPDLLSESMPEANIIVIRNTDELPPVAPSGKTVFVMDAETEADMEVCLEKIRSYPSQKILAGCAGFANYLPKLISFRQQHFESWNKTSGILIVCGSINPITVRQIEKAEKSGFVRFSLSVEQKMTEGYFESVEGIDYLNKIFDTCRNGTPVIIDVLNNGGTEATEKYAVEHGILKEEISKIIVRQLAVLVEKWLENNFDYTVMISGGDTLMALADCLDCSGINPICELSNGIVVSELLINDRSIQMVSKSGGFGSDTELIDIWNIIRNNKEDDNYG